MKTMTDIKKYTYWQNAEIPIVIGVSAHRKIKEECIPEIEQKVGEVLDFFLEKYPHTPILMLNGMAMGGDLLCARVAKEKFEKGAPVRLCIVIPDEEEEYLSGTSNGEDDFSPEDKDLYYEIKNCETPYGKFVIDDKPFIAPDMEKAGERTRRYNFRQQAIYVATKCHVLLALWDGEGANGENGEGIKKTACGTPAAVSFALRHNYIQPYGTEFYSAYDGAVIKILTPRADSQGSEAGTISYLTPENPEEETAAFPKNLNEILLRTDLFNADYLKYCKKQKKKLRRQEKGGADISELIIPKESRFLLGKEEYDNGSDKLKRIHDCSKVASELSSENKKKFNTSVKVLGVFGFFLLFFFMFYDQFNSLITVILFLLMLSSILAGYLIIRIINSERFIIRFKLRGKPCGVHTKSVEYRALSEAMRVQYYLSACGIYYNVGNYFSWTHKNEIVWIKKAVTGFFVGNDVNPWQTEEKQKPAAVKNPQEQAVPDVDNSEAALSVDNSEKEAYFGNVFHKWVGNDETKADKKVNGQIGYHLQNKIDMEKGLKKKSAAGACITLFTIAAYYALFVLELLTMSGAVTTINLDDKLLGVNIRMLLKMILCILSAITYFISYYYGKQGLERKAADSENMINLFRIAMHRAKAISQNDLLYTTDRTKEEAFKSLMKELANEQITENGVWISYNRDNNLDLPL